MRRWRWACCRGGKGQGAGKGWGCTGHSLTGKLRLRGDARTTELDGSKEGRRAACVVSSSPAVAALLPARPPSCPAPRSPAARATFVPQLLACAAFPGSQKPLLPPAAAPPPPPGPSPPPAPAAPPSDPTAPGDGPAAPPSRPASPTGLAPSRPPGPHPGLALFGSGFARERYMASGAGGEDGGDLWLGGRGRGYKRKRVRRRAGERGAAPRAGVLASRACACLTVGVAGWGSFQRPRRPYSRMLSRVFSCPAIWGPQAATAKQGAAPVALRVPSSSPGTQPRGARSGLRRGGAGDDRHGGRRGGGAVSGWALGVWGGCWSLSKHGSAWQSYA
jgi:hypothetical protein